MTTPRARRPHGSCGRHRRDTPRTLHLIDLENLCPGGRVTSTAVDSVWARYTANVGVYADDGVVVAVDRRNAATAFFALPNGIRRVIGRGRDGADLALLAAAETEWATRRFERIVVASGDHIFAPRIREWQAAGSLIELVRGDGRMARVLVATGAPVHRLPAA